MTTTTRTPVTTDTIADSQIRSLRAEALVAGDTNQVAVCDRALGGNLTARRLCVAAINEAAAQG